MQSSVSESVIPQVVSDLTTILGDRVSTSGSVLQRHGMDESFHAPRSPDVVVFPVSTEEVAEIVRICAEREVPVIPFGAGTSLEGHVAALRGGVCIDLMQMNKILKLNVEDLDVKVQAGVTRNQLNDHLRNFGLFFPIDPGADASLGGMAATCASGTTTVRYGTMRDNVLSLQVVLADGRVIRTASRARKSSAGYDLTRLFIGSEGTLGVITQVTLRLYGVPEAISAAVSSFETVEGAVSCVIETIQLGVPVARIEFLDEVQLGAVNRFAGLDHPIAPTLFFEFHGSEASVVEQAKTVSEIASRYGGGDFKWAVHAAERERLWRARHNALYAGLSLRPGSKAMVADVCVPISRLAECILKTREDLNTSQLMTPIVGHVGDGNCHVFFIIDPEDPEELTEAKRLNDRLVRRALEMGGTCTGEHGIGSGKIEYLEEEHGEAVAVMQRIKAALDPKRIMNPGKVLPDRIMAREGYEPRSGKAGI